MFLLVKDVVHEGRMQIGEIKRENNIAPKKEAPRVHPRICTSDGIAGQGYDATTTMSGPSVDGPPALTQCFVYSCAFSVSGQEW